MLHTLSIIWHVAWPPLTGTSLAFITYAIALHIKKHLALVEELLDYKHRERRPRPGTQVVEIQQGTLLYQLFERQLRAGDRATKALEKIADGLEGVEDALPLRKEAKEPSDG